MPPNQGGGIATQFGSLTVSNCTVSGNTGTQHCGGIFNALGSTLKITNSTVSGNSGSGVGGIFSAGALTVNNSTITGNIGIPVVAPTPGPTTGGIMLNDNTSSTLQSTIVAGNSRNNGTPGDIDGFSTISAASYNLIGDAATSGGIANGTNGNIVGNSGTGTIDIHTVLDTNLAFNGGPTRTHRLQLGGPAVDQGKDFGAPLGGTTYDQRGFGFPRAFDLPAANASGGDGTDMGAFEIVPPPLVLTRATSAALHVSPPNPPFPSTFLPFEIDLPLSGNPGIECRNGDLGAFGGGVPGRYNIFFYFPSQISATSDATASCGTIIFRGIEREPDQRGVRRRSL